VSVETRNRIRVAVAAYTYEIESRPIMTDADFDELAGRIEPNVTTGKVRLDRFFRDEFSPHTGQWVHKHPDPKGLKRIFRMLTDDFRNSRDLFEPYPAEPEYMVLARNAARFEQQNAAKRAAGEIKNPCRVCGLDVTLNPAFGGCHC